MSGIDIFSKLKRNVLEPKVYAIMAASAQGQVLHLGIHFSLDEAYTAAKKKIVEMTKQNATEPVDMELWNMIPARQVIAKFVDPAYYDEMAPMLESKTLFVNESSVDPNMKLGMDVLLDALMTDVPVPNSTQTVQSPTLSEQIKNFRNSKNQLMKMLIDNGDIKQVDKIKDLLGAPARKYVIKEIENKTRDSKADITK